eukprot:4163921-Prymnesium_polylepis.1
MRAQASGQRPRCAETASGPPRGVRGGPTRDGTPVPALPLGRGAAARGWLAGYVGPPQRPGPMEDGCDAPIWVR